MSQPITNYTNKELFLIVNTGESSFTIGDQEVEVTTFTAVTLSALLGNLLGDLDLPLHAGSKWNVLFIHRAPPTVHDTCLATIAGMLDVNNEGLETKVDVVGESREILTFAVAEAQRCGVPTANGEFTFPKGVLGEGISDLVAGNREV